MSEKAQKRYSSTIEAAITLAIARCERITIEAPGASTRPDPVRISFEAFAGRMERTKP